MLLATLKSAPSVYCWSTALGWPFCEPLASNFSSENEEDLVIAVIWPPSAVATERLGAKVPVSV